MHFVLGVDGGNTKTIALVASLNGAILGAGRGGCGDIYNAPTSTEWQDSASAAIANVDLVSHPRGPAERSMIFLRDAQALHPDV